MKKLGAGDNSLVSWELVKYCRGVYVVVVRDNYSRAMLFLRAQEYYESPEEKYCGKNFSIFDFMDYFRKLRGMDVFSYPAEWMGFNVPGESLERCMVGVRGMNEYDREMKKVLNLIRGDTSGKFYLLGVDKLDSGLFDHELAHAFYYLSKEYRLEMSKLVSKLSKKKLGRMKSLLLGWGYRESVLVDEVQAYLGTGLGEGQGEIFSGRDCAKFVKYFNNYKSSR